MNSRVIVKKVPVTALINILIKLEKKGKKYVDLTCSINPEDLVQDRIMISPYKKDKKKKSKKLTEARLEQLLKNI